MRRSGATHLRVARRDPRLDESEAEEFEIDEQDLRIECIAPAAGGTGVNTTDSAVRITTCRPARGRMPERTLPAPEQGHRDGHLEGSARDLSAQREEQNDEIRGERKAVDFGSRSDRTCLLPYQMVKDPRTNVEVGTSAGACRGYRPLHRSELRRRASG